MSASRPSIVARLSRTSTLVVGEDDADGLEPGSPFTLGMRSSTRNPSPVGPRGAAAEQLGALAHPASP